MSKGAYKVVEMDLGALEAKHPGAHSSGMEEYLDAMLAEGWEFVTSTVDANGYRWIFKAAPKAKAK